jgi:hypothetical protein
MQFLCKYFRKGWSQFELKSYMICPFLRIMQNWFVDQMFHLKRFFPIYKCKNCFPSCCPSRPLGIIICTSLNLHYVKKLLCKYKLFWLSGSRKEKIQWINPIFTFLWLSPLTQEPGPSIRRLFILFTQGWFVPSLIEISPLVLEKIFLKIIYKVFPIVAPPEPQGPWFVQTWIYIMSESFHVNMSSSGSMVLKKIFFNI